MRAIVLLSLNGGGGGGGVDINVRKSKLVQEDLNFKISHGSP